MQPTRILNIILNSLLLFLAKQLYSQIDSCTYDTSNNRYNIGLFGGSCNDLTYSNNNRLFAATESPLGLFYSDDSAKSWTLVFPIDSLFYECGERGWGGNTKRILTNSKGWSFAQSENASILSTQYGDTGSWHTIMDVWLMEQIGYVTNNVNGIGLTDYKLYTLMGSLIVISDTNTLDTIIDVSKNITGIDSTSDVISIAAVNDSINNFFFCVIDTTTVSSSIEPHGLLYLYNGSSFSQIVLPSNLIYGIYAVYLNNSSSDTLFITGRINSQGDVKTYRSYDGGLNWTSIDHNFSNKGRLLTDVDYSAAWKSSFPQGAGIILSCQASYISYDLGNNWDSVYTLNSASSAFAVHPANTNMLLKSFPSGIVISHNGNIGPFNYAENEGLMAVTVSQIAQTPGKGEFYIATSAGVGYTTAYLIDTVAPLNKWKQPYGSFPLTIGDDIAVSAIEVNPYDSLNVIAGSAGMYNVTYSGVNGFMGFTSFSSTSDYWVNDIAFYDSLTVIVVTGNKLDNQGNIWRSANKGLSWTKVTPTGFTCGNTIAVRKDLSVTKKIYVGCGKLEYGTGSLWYSIDAGKNWTKLNDGPNHSSISFATSLPIHDIAVHPNSDDTLYFASGAVEYSEFFKSTDGGNTYMPITVKNIFNETPSSILLRSDSPDSALLAYGATISLYDAIKDTSVIIFRGFYGEQIPDMASGSILIGTTTGFFTVNIEPFEDIIDRINSIFVLANDIYVYPIPANNKLFIKFGALSSNEKLTIQISDLYGNLLDCKKQNLENGLLQVYLPTLRSGTYYLKISSSEKVYSHKIIIIK